MVHFELLSVNVIITSEFLNTTLNKNWSSLINCKDMEFHHDNLCSHTAKITSEKICWEKVSQTPYSADLSTPDYHLSQSFKNYLGIDLEIHEEPENYRILFFLFLCEILKGAYR